MLTRLWVCLMDVPGKFDVSALCPAIELNSVLLPLLGWPTKMTAGTSGGFMDGFDEDLLGDAAAEGDGRVRGAVADEERPPEDGFAVELDDVVLVESHSHKAAPDALATGEVDDPEGRAVGGVEESHGVTCRPVYPILYMNQGNSPIPDFKSY